MTPHRSPEPSVTDRAKGKATQLGETLGSQAGQIAKTTGNKTAELAEQAKHEAQEFAEMARSAVRNGGTTRPQKRTGIGAVTAFAVAIAAARWLKNAGAGKRIRAGGSNADSGDTHV